MDARDVVGALETFCLPQLISLVPITCQYDDLDFLDGRSQGAFDMRLSKKGSAAGTGAEILNNVAQKYMKQTRPLPRIQCVMARLSNVLWPLIDFVQQETYYFQNTVRLFHCADWFNNSPFPQSTKAYRPEQA